jgi:hypothetical protein
MSFMSFNNDHQAICSVGENFSLRQHGQVVRLVEHGTEVVKARFLMEPGQVHDLVGLNPQDLRVYPRLKGQSLTLAIIHRPSGGVWQLEAADHIDAFALAAALKESILDEQYTEHRHYC